MTFLANGLLYFFNKHRNFIKNRSHHFLIKFINFFVSLIITTILIRGGIQERPLDWGYAHYSNDNMLNETAQNPLFFFGRSLIEMRSESIYKNFLIDNNIESSSLERIP